MIQDPNGIRTLEDYLKKVKAEAAYFGEDKGERTFYLVTDITGADKIPAIAEPLFQGFKAKVEFHPVMTADDLRKGLQFLRSVNL